MKTHVTTSRTIRTLSPSPQSSAAEAVSVPAHAGLWLPGQRVHPEAQPAAVVADAVARRARPRRRRRLRGGDRGSGTMAV